VLVGDVNVSYPESSDGSHLFPGDVIWEDAGTGGSFDLV